MSVADDFALPGEETTPPAGATTTQQQPSGKDLRTQLEQSLAANKALQERLDKVEAVRRTRDLTDLVKSAGLPEAAAARYPGDAEVTPEKVTEWATAEKAYAAQLAGQPAPNPGAEPAATTQPAPPVGVTPQAVTAQQLADQAQAGAQAPAQGLDGMLARLRDPSVSWPQLQQEMRSMGWRPAP
jgi:hypothetical protein